MCCGSPAYAGKVVEFVALSSWHVLLICTFHVHLLLVGRRSSVNVPRPIGGNTKLVANVHEKDDIL